MARAFLSHSTADKAYVDIVARQLSRSRVVYDRQDFEPGVDFRDSIRRGLDQASLFVLFASAKSLASGWVKFEIDEAEIRQISGKLTTALVIVNDPGVKPADLPAWMRKALFCPFTRPSQAARLILSKLMQHEGADQHTLFVGREELLKEVGGQLPPPGGLPSPQILVFSGLEGVGRRSAATRALKDNLSLSMGPVLSLEETDDLRSLYLQLLEDRAAFSTREEYKSAIGRFQSAPSQQQAKMIALEIDGLAKDNTATIIVDQGALINDSGMFKDEVTQVFDEIVQSTSEPYIVVIQRRRPPLSQTSGANRIASFAVRPLSLDATRRLFVQAYKVATNSPPKDDAVQELTPYLDGYPPAVQLAIAYSKRYGLDALIEDKSALVDLKVRTFDRVLKKLQLDEVDQRILRVLGIEPTLSLDVLATILDAQTADIVPRVNRLIDHSVVVRYPDTLALAAPMRSSVYREFGNITPGEYAVFAKRLRGKYWVDPELVPSLEAIDATIYTSARAHESEFETFADIVIPSMLLKIANSAYHERDWKTARDFAVRATTADPKPDKGWVILAKANIRLAHDGAADWSQAEAVLAKLKERGHRAQYYVAGFLSWKRGDLKSAVKFFRQAEKAGDRGVAVYRDRAHCEYQLGQVNEAAADIKVALDRYPRNPFVVDLAAAIAIRGGKYAIAEQFLKDLKEVELRKEHYHHRRATLYAARKQFEPALAEADLAVRRQPPLHEILTNRIDILIELGKYNDALKELDSVEQQFKGKAAKDVQTGLRCKLALRQGDWREAEQYYMTFNNKDLPVHNSLLAELLRQKASDNTVSAAERATASDESHALIKEVTATGLTLSFTFDDGHDSDDSE